MIFFIRITEACNLNCSHCYAQDNPEATISVEDFKKVWEECKKTPGYAYAQAGGQEITVYLSGGEPTIHPNFKGILKHVGRLFDKGELDSCAILSNGFGITEDVCKILQVHHGFRASISMDGTEASHDMIRGNGSYTIALNSLKLLKKYEIPRGITYTVGRDNSSKEDVQNVANGIRLYASRYCNISPRVNVPGSFNFKEWIEFRNSFADKEIKENYQYSNHSCCWMSECGSERTVVVVNPDLTVSGCPRDSVQNRRPLNEMVSVNYKAFLENRQAIDACLKDAIKTIS